MKEKRGKKEEDRKQSKFACYKYLSTPSATRSVARPSSKRDNYIVLLSTHQTFVKFSLCISHPTNARPSSKRDNYIVLLSTHQTFVKFSLFGEGVAATKPLTREWKREFTAMIS